MIAVVDYGMGNVGSVLNMLRKVGAPAIVTSDPMEIARADKLILPGVGAFGAGMASLHERGLIPTLERRVLEDGVPILGICLGLQLFSASSDESPEHGLGWIRARTTRFAFAGRNGALKVPHMGWNTIAITRPDDPMVADMDSEPRFYFVHSFHLGCDDPSLVVATCTYGYEFPVALRYRNIFGVQFHPEKSHRYGLRLMANFAAGCSAWRPSDTAASAGAPQ